MARNPLNLIPMALNKCQHLFEDDTLLDIIDALALLFYDVADFLLRHIMGVRLAIWIAALVVALWLLRRENV